MCFSTFQKFPESASETGTGDTVAQQRKCSMGPKIFDRPFHHDFQQVNYCRSSHYSQCFAILGANCS